MSSKHYRNNKKKTRYNYRNKYQRVTTPTKRKRKSRFSTKEIDEMSNQDFWRNLSIEEINKYQQKKRNKNNYTLSVKSAEPKNYVEIIFIEKHQDLLAVKFQENVKQTEKEWKDLCFDVDGIPMFDEEKGTKTNKNKKKIIKKNT